MEASSAGRQAVRSRLRLHRLASEGRFGEADKLADAILAETPDDVHVRYQKGANYFQAQRFDEAISVFEAILRIDPQNADAWRAIGICLAEQGQYAEALPAYRAALKCKPDDPITLNEMGKALAQLGKHAEAVEAFGSAAIAEPRFGEALHYLAVSLDQVGRYDDAFATFHQAVTVDPGRADAWFDRGSHLMRVAVKDRSLGLVYEALRSYECALSIEPHHELAARGRDEVLEFLGPDRAAARPTPPASAPRCQGEGST